VKLEQTRLYVIYFKSEVIVSDSSFPVTIIRYIRKRDSCNKQTITEYIIIREYCISRLMDFCSDRVRRRRRLRFIVNVVAQTKVKYIYELADSIDRYILYNDSTYVLYRYYEMYIHIVIQRYLIIIIIIIIIWFSNYHCVQCVVVRNLKWRRFCVQLNNYYEERKKSTSIVWL